MMKANRILPRSLSTFFAASLDSLDMNLGSRNIAKENALIPWAAE
jgi:hypothetical protein